MSIQITRDHGVATVLLNRPDKLNALSGEMYHELAERFVELDRDDEELVYTARRLPAQEAKDMGIVMKVVPDDRLEAEAQALAQELAASATYALTLAKRMFHSMYVPGLEQLLEMEILAAGGARFTHDHKEDVAAFKEKRKPKFTGR